MDSRDLKAKLATAVIDRPFKAVVIAFILGGTLVLLIGLAI